jgi:hypothetical protein
LPDGSNLIACGLQRERPPTIPLVAILATAGACTVMMMMMKELVLVLWLHRMVMAQFLEAAIVLGFALFDEGVNGVQAGIGGAGNRPDGQRHRGNENISHGGSPDSIVGRRVTFNQSLCAV